MQLMCQKTVLRFSIKLTVTCSNLITSTLINEYDKRAAVEISTVFGPVYHVACPRVLSSDTLLIFI